MASEIKAQEFVHTLEHGRGRWWVIFLLIIAFAAFQTVTHVFINPMNRQGGLNSIFVGLTHPKGMEQAIIARELARGHGFSTLEIKPAAIDLVEKKKGDGAFAAFLDPNGPTRGVIPDYYHAPLNPWVNSVALRIVAGVSDAFHIRVDEKGHDDYWGLGTAEYVYAPDRAISLVSVFFFLASVLFTFLTARLLFDERLATFAVVLVLLCNQFWQFSSTGLPQMLMVFLFNVAIYLMTRALAERAASRFLWPLYAGIGLCFGLLALAHPLTAFIFAGALVFSAVAFRPLGRAALVMLAVFLACIGPWLVRNHQVCGSAFGLGARTVTFGLRGSESQIMRTLSKEDQDVPPTHFRIKVQGGLIEQLDKLYSHLGKVIAAPIFFLALLHAFRKRETRSLRWGVLLMLIFAALGMAIFGFPDKDIRDRGLQANDLYPLFIPTMTAYGLGLLLVMWSRVQFMGRELARIRQTNMAFQGLVGFISAFPLLSAYTDPPKIPFVWPPYCPPALAYLTDWYSKNDIICSDMPWAIGWYSDRKSLWLPLTTSDFSELSDFRFFGRITGLFLTPITGFLGVLDEITVGEFKSWSAFIMRDPRAAASFPLKVANAIPVMGAKYYILFADRDRWTERNN